MCVIQRGMRNGGPPLTADIAGQEHMLAYITPQEGGLLKAAGGAGKPGPMGIMSFFDVGEGELGYDSGGDSANTAGGLGDPDGSSYGGGGGGMGEGQSSVTADTFSTVSGGSRYDGDTDGGYVGDDTGQYYTQRNQVDYVNEDTATMGRQFANRREAQKYADMVSKVPLGTSYGTYRTPDQQKLADDKPTGIRGIFSRLNAARYNPYSLNRQDLTTGAPRAYGGLTEDQVKALSERKDFIGKKAYAAHLAAKQGNVKDGAFGYMIDPDDPNRVGGYTHDSGLPSLGFGGLMKSLFGENRINEVYTGDSDLNPFDESNWNDNDGGDEVVKKKDPCPEGYVYSEESNSCIKVETDEDGERGTSFKLNTEPFPDLSRYGRDGKGEYRFFTEMPGILNMQTGGLPSLKKKELPRQPTGEVVGPGGPKDDLVGPIALSNREYVEPYERVLDEGNGNYKRGIEVLEKKRHAALRKYRDRVKSENSRAA